MDFELQWLLLGLPAAFALGWMASRLDVRQWKREQRESPKAYFKGLNLLLNEQHDRAIDAFIEAVQQDPDTSDLHFALGNLFRRRGEYERAVRVHEHLLQRADLSRGDRERAQHALAQDFMKAGLFDRAEQAWHALEGSVYDTEARLALLTLHERSRDWRSAVDMAQKLERSGTGSYASRIAHYWCELALEADARGQTADADDALRRAREAAPQASRPLVMAGERALTSGRGDEAMQAWESMAAAHPAAFGLVAARYAEAALQGGRSQPALDVLRPLYQQAPHVDLLNALNTLEPGRRSERLSEHLAHHPSLSVARALLALRAQQASPAGALAGSEDLQRIDQAMAAGARPLQRYRCAACGFEAQHYFWQCPGCHNWDTYPPRRIEEL